jgi:AraC family transcriptional regulator
MTFLNDEIEIFAEIHLLLQSGFKKRIRVRDLARQYNISQSTLTRGFQHHYHKTVQEHRLTCCMQYAKLLMDKGQQIKSVRMELGYKTSGGFTKAFRRVFGHIPQRDQGAI